MSGKTTTRTTVESDVKLEKKPVKWDPKTLEIRTHSVEKTLEPLVHQVTTLVNHPKKKGKAGKSKNAHKLAREIEDATKKLIQVGEEIAQDFPEIREEMLKACKDTRQTGDGMRVNSKEFADDPCSSAKRANMVRGARALLSSVTRLLCIADMADVYRLLASLKLVEERLKELEKANNSEDLKNSFKNLGNDLMELAKLAGKRQADLKDPRRKDEMAMARATLKDSSKMLLTTSRAFVNNPDLVSAKANRDYVMKQMCEAVQSISGAAQATGPSEPGPLETPGALAAALNDLDSMINMDPASYSEKRMRPTLEERLESIVSGAARLADSPSTRDNTRERIINECNNVRKALQDLLSQYQEYASGKKKHSSGDSLDQAIARMCKNTRDLRSQLRKAVVDHVSDSYLETNVPLLLLIEAAQSGNGKEVEECAVVFTEHAAKLEEVAHYACAMSNNVEGIKIARIAARHIHSLCPQVINAARTLAARPNSKVAKENMEVFRQAWEDQVRLLVDAVDDITNIDDFLAVSEAHILEDVNKCVQAVQEGDIDALDRVAGALKGRTARVDNVVSSEMENFETGPYTEKVLRAVTVMRERVMPQFAQQIDQVVDELNQDPNADIDEDKFIDASKLVYEGMRDIRRAVVMNRERPVKDPNVSSSTHDESASDMDEIDPTGTDLLAEAQAKAREQAAYAQLQAGGKIRIQIRAAGGDDPSGTNSSIRVNGMEYCPNKRGHNIVVLDASGEVVDSQNFDTFTSDAKHMSRYLDSLPEQHMVLIATQDTTGKGIESASTALNRLGAQGPFNPGPKGSWAFAGYTGPGIMYWCQESTKPRYHGPSEIEQFITTPAAIQGQVKVEVNSEATDDPETVGHASIKVNAIERCPKQRGHNIVVLDSAGNFVTARNFDTFDTSKGEGLKMAKFLDELPKERIVLAAVQGSTGAPANDAKAAFERLGAKGSVNPNPGFNASWAFIGYTGPEDVKWAKLVTNSRFKGPSQISEFIQCPGLEAEQAPIQAGSVSDYEHGVSDYEPDYEDKSGAYSDYEDVNEANKSLSKRSARSLMRALPESEKVQIAQLAETLKIEKLALDREITKWDESGNDIILLSKKMCMMMMEMSDFTRGCGPLKTTMDVIDAAKRIAKAGSRMTKLATEIANQCPDSSSKSDLNAYIQRIALYSHQLTITSRVKADVQMISGELVVTGLESATSLITAARNLMNAVILTVKASYVASTKHKSGEVKSPVVQWRMKAPDKKPLVHSESDDWQRVVQRSSQSQQQTPIQALSEFDTSREGSMRRKPDYF